MGRIVLVDSQSQEKKSHPYAVSITLTRVNPLLNKHEVEKIEKLQFEGPNDANLIYHALVNYMQEIVPKPKEEPEGAV